MSPDCTSAKWHSKLNHETGWTCLSAPLHIIGIITIILSAPRRTWRRHHHHIHILLVAALLSRVVAAMMTRVVAALLWLRCCHGWWLRCCHGWWPHCCGCAVVTGGGSYSLSPPQLALFAANHHHHHHHHHHPISTPPHTVRRYHHRQRIPYLHPNSHCSPTIFTIHLANLRQPLVHLGVHLGIFHRNPYLLTWCIWGRTSRPCILLPSHSLDPLRRFRQRFEQISSAECYISTTSIPITCTRRLHLMVNARE